VPPISPEEQLSDHRYVVLVLRLVVDRHGRLIQGDVLSEPAAVRRAFRGWRGLARAIRGLLTLPSPDRRS
jgi:hypothetical protein